MDSDKLDTILDAVDHMVTTITAQVRAAYADEKFSASDLALAWPIVEASIGLFKAITGRGEEA